MSPGCSHSSRSALAWASWTSGAGAGMGLVGELAVEPGADLPSVAQRPVADAQRVLAAGDEVGDELVDGGDPRADDLLHATGHCPVHRENTSPLRASMTGTTTRSDCRCGNASRSSDEIPIIGTRNAWANALPVARPTRIPVNNPGPTSTATSPISSSATSACAQQNLIAGTRVSACRRPRAISNKAMTPS